ncbi:hypothetical protein [Chlamydiifrater volucris]|uniref:hypothetical protein n=1 Tax=Chlamydiifrater volucris TaxID=2681470 RepID=UPI001BCF47DB|nr:hypothetical protein [Chlamydiifrater volucris]
MNKNFPFGKAFFSLSLHVVCISLLSLDIAPSKRPLIKLREHFVETFVETSLLSSEQRVGNSSTPLLSPTAIPSSRPQEGISSSKSLEAREYSSTVQSSLLSSQTLTPKEISEKTLPSKQSPQKLPSETSREQKTFKEKLPSPPTKVILNTKTDAPSQQKQNTADNYRNEKLRELAKMANEMTKRLEADNKRLHDPVLRKTAVFVSTGDDAENSVGLNPENLTQLLRKHLVLPLPGILRMQLSISPTGELLNCLIYESETELNKQYVLSKIHKISFEDFVKKHKNSKNISFHIKLVGEP